MVIRRRSREIASRIFKRNFVVIISAIILALYLVFRNSSNFIRISGAIGLMFFFYFFDHRLNVNFRLRHYFFIIIIAVTGILMSELYFIYPQYDKVLHFFLPILLFSIYFHMVSRVKINFRWQLLYTFFAVIATLAMFEIGEYVIDYLFDWKLQGVFEYQGDRWNLGGLTTFKLLVDPIDDTMVDLSLGVLGSMIYWIISYARLRRIEKIKK